MTQAATSAPAAASEAVPVSATADVQAAGDSDAELRSNDDIAEALERDEEEDAGRAAERLSGQGIGAKGDSQSGRGEAGAGQGAFGGEAGPVPVPATWKAEEKDLFGKLPPELQRAVARRESERERFVADKSNEAAVTRQAHEKMAAYVNSTLGPAILAAQVAIEADFAGVDWNALQKEDPVTFLKLDAARNERLAAVNRAVHGFAQFQEHQNKLSHQAETKRLHGEFVNVVPKIRDIIGDGYEPKTFRNDVAAYLSSIGAPNEHINGISHGYMLEMAAKAMLYDRQSKAREAAGRKIADAPKMQKTKAREANDRGRDVGAARELLRTKGSSAESVSHALEKLGF